MKLQKSCYGVVVCAFLLGFAFPAAGADFNFTYPEIPLTAPGSLPLTEVNVDFDNANVLHSVWTDDVSSVKQTFGSTVFRDGSVLGKFPAMIQIPVYNYALPFIHRNVGDTSKMFVFAINRTAIAPDSRIESATWDLTLLPAAPGVIQTASFDTGTMNILDRSKLDMLSVGEMVVCAFVVNSDIHVVAFDTLSGTWGTPTIIPANANQYLTIPRLAKDDSRNIYLSYDLYNMPLMEHSLIVRSTMMPEQIIDWWPEVLVDTSMGNAFSAELAVAGSSLNQKTALVYATGLSPILIYSNVAIGNSWPMSGIWTGTPVLAAAIPVVTVFNGPEIAYSPDGSRLYIVWADDRESLNAEIYGVTSYNGGMTFGNFEVLTNSAVGEFIPETPRIAVGTDIGNLAVSFIRTTGAGSSPFVLLSMADFLDTCDGSPTLYWDTSSGVTVDGGTFLSPPASYRLANAKDRGTLLRDYGLIEQTGVVSLYFYDDPSITGVDFIVELENANSKGVIRMLGVRNDTTQQNYSYNNSGVWIDSGIPRQLGWHQIEFRVDASGLAMSIEHTPGSVATWTDNTFTSFTSITIEGGDTTDPYYVDEIQVLAIPAPVSPPIPALSWFGMLICLVLTGAIIIRRR